MAAPRERRQPVKAVVAVLLVEVYDAWNRLVKAVNTLGGTVTYGVDARGRRITTTVSGSITTCTTPPPGRWSRSR
jgi:YD repeat-containing protein